MYYFLYIIFVIIWIIGVYYFFNWDNFREKNENRSQSTFDVIAAQKESKIRIIFDPNNINNLDMKSLSDLTVKYSDLISGNYTLHRVDKSEIETLAEKDKPEKAENMDLSNYINIFTIKFLNCNKK